MAVQVYRDGKVHVRGAKCGNCLFSKDRLVPGDRARQLVTTTRGTLGGSFVCHRSQVTDEPEAICSAWFENFATDDPIFRLAIASGIIEYTTTQEDH